MDEKEDSLDMNIENANSDFIQLKKGTLSNMEEEIIDTFLHENYFNRQIVAEKLNISRSTLHRKLKNRLS
jgi:DNA-binding NtrC family response regulator